MSAGGTVAFLDVSAGVAGDMLLGALVDAGLPVAALQDLVDALGLAGVRVTARRVQKGPLAATKVDVLLPGEEQPVPESEAHSHGHDHDHDHEGDHDHDHDHGHDHEHRHKHEHGHEKKPERKAAHHATHEEEAHPHAHGARERRAEPHSHRKLPDVLSILRKAKGLPPEGVADAVRAFTLLAEAEGRVHGIPPEEVQFHEVGALDAIVDIAGTCVGLRRLGVLEVRASSLPWFSGAAPMAHGLLPLPAPAVVHLLAGLPTHPSGETFEQVTPTGAALVRALSRGPLPPAGFVPRAVGVGAGNHPGGRLPNVVRLVLGERSGDEATDAVLLETNLDDATGQQAAHAIERALALGALDAWATPVVMKKGRPGLVLSVLAVPADVQALEAVLFLETPTLGVRRRPVSRTTLPRRLVSVSTRYGPIHVKVRTTPAGDAATPEYDDCVAAAERAGVALSAVQAAALAAWRETNGG